MPSLGSYQPASYDPLNALLGTSAVMLRLRDLIRTSSRLPLSTLILGESGTGKELAARIIHDLSPRRTKPFVPVDCAAIVSTLVESELFGCVKGAFTGADYARIGLLQSASGGTLFLDEIGEMPLHCQAKLLRVLQEHEFRPVGGTQTIHVNIRVVAATNRNLQEEVQSGRFRQDLYFRLNVLAVRLPGLRERKSDIPLLVTSFLAKHQDLNPAVSSVSEAAMKCLLAYDWPGNVRELEHAVQHALAITENSVIEKDDLPSSISGIEWQSVSRGDGHSLAQLERWAIFEALKKTGGDKLAAARLLQIGKTTLYRRLKEFRKCDSWHEASVPGD